MTPAARLLAALSGAAAIGGVAVAVLADGDRTDRLADVTVPTLVIHGARDPMVRVEGGRALAAAVPGADYLELADVGHELPVSVHDEVVDAVLTHVRRAEAGVTS